ncbi:LL-diaminopimelate aminotransferase [Schaalia sp. JY-X169]|jgi:LL-diaminopimelate aminotransferase|uniref:LL-diaminopimelate aminotransferase n=1 Tax=Schaalia sp. JY-X169 TaxID=2758572 RepID=UPI0015F5115E|nr:LL-diaminopimelate aminotransferase [Schaalia sp. JY-X169]
MLNEEFQKIPSSYLFSDIAKKVGKYQETHPDQQVLRLGIGDVTLPLAPAVVAALHEAVDEQASSETFAGYGPEQGYGFLREAIAEGEYGVIGVSVDPDEIFVGDGAKSDTGNIQELFSVDASVAVADPVYPVYVDSNAMAGRLGEYRDGTWSNLTYLSCTEANGYKPPFPSEHVDLIYLCYPNNPTGTTLTRSELEGWVDYARHNGSIILFDAAYRAFITDDSIPRSIYEIDGAREVALEFGSFSKTAGFTGLRCSWTVVPKELQVEGVSLHAMWNRRQSTKFNGTPYVVQKAATAIYTPEGRVQVQEAIDYYLRNAALIRDALLGSGIEAVGGDNSPYVWFKCPGGMDSWEFFDYLLNNAQIVGTPGVGFGPAGEGQFRLSAFGSFETTSEAVRRLQALLPTLKG